MKENIRQLSEICKKWNVKLMIGGGVNEANAADILALGVDFIHGSFSIKESFKNDIFHLGTVHKSDAALISRITKLCNRYS
jgi:copper homeostasis protein CutC